jgi:hypothetical protein
MYTGGTSPSEDIWTLATLAFSAIWLTTPALRGSLGAPAGMRSLNAKVGA